MKIWFHTTLHTSLVPTHKTYVSAQMQEAVLIYFFFFKFSSWTGDKAFYLDTTQHLHSSETQNFLNP